MCKGLLIYSLCYGSMSISLDPIADVINRCSWPYDLEGLAWAPTCYIYSLHWRLQFLNRNPLTNSLEGRVSRSRVNSPNEHSSK